MSIREKSLFMEVEKILEKGWCIFFNYIFFQKKIIKTQ